MASSVRRLESVSRDPLAGGYYTVKEACRLLSIAQPGKVTGWLQGHKNSASPPVIVRSYTPVSGVQELSFLDLIEVRFVEHFRKQGVSLQALRRAADTLRAEQKLQHPFATSNAMFLTDRKAVFMKTAEEVRDTTLLNLVTRQFEMYTVLEEVLARGVDFDPSSGVAREWKPRPREFGAVVLNPLLAFGQPCVSITATPTDTIFNAWKSEGGHYTSVAEWFDIDERYVREAVEFELSLPN